MEELYKEGKKTLWMVTENSTVYTKSQSLSGT